MEHKNFKFKIFKKKEQQREIKKKIQCGSYQKKAVA